MYIDAGICPRGGRLVVRDPPAESKQRLVPTMRERAHSHKKFDGYDPRCDALAARVPDCTLTMMVLRRKLEFV